MDSHRERCFDPGHPLLCLPAPPQFTPFPSGQRRPRGKRPQQKKKIIAVHGIDTGLRRGYARARHVLDVSALFDIEHARYNAQSRQRSKIGYCFVNELERLSDSCSAKSYLVMELK